MGRNKSLHSSAAGRKTKRRDMAIRKGGGVKKDVQSSNKLKKKKNPVQSRSDWLNSMTASMTDQVMDGDDDDDFVPLNGPGDAPKAAQRRPVSSRYHQEMSKVLEAADVVLQVLDARDPIGTRSDQVEQRIVATAGKKRLVQVSSIRMTNAT